MATATATKTTKKTAAKTSSKTPAKSTASHTPARHVRIPDDIWTAADTNARQDDYTGVSELIRSLLRDYNEGKRMRVPKA